MGLRRKIIRIPIAIKLYNNPFEITTPAGRGSAQSRLARLVSETADRLGGSRRQFVRMGVLSDPMNVPETDSRVALPARRGVVAVVVRDQRLLVIRRSRHVVAPLAICFPGGGIEEGETEPLALIRELREELSVDVAPIRCVWRSMTRWNVSLAWWLTVLSPDAELIPNPAEVDSTQWLSPTELLAHGDLLASNREFLTGVLRQEISLERANES